MSESESDLEDAPTAASTGTSLDTTIGFNTEVGRETQVDSSSSSGTMALSDPTLGSTDSSRPPLATPQIAARRQSEPQPRPEANLPPVPAEEHKPAVLSLPVAGGATRGKPPAPAAPGQPAQAGAGPPSAPPAKLQLLQLLQQQQNAQMLPQLECQPHQLW